jgi:hypothetical protein
VNYLKTNDSKSITTVLIQLISLLSIVFVIGIQFYYRNPYISSWDQVDFALALSRYDIMAMQPHFPGYPYFILGGTLVHQWLKNPAEAFTLFNSMLYGSALFPIYQLIRRYAGKEYALLLTAIIYSGSYCLVIVNQPMSEGAALAVLWWYVWSIQYVLEKNTEAFILLPLFLFSLLLGIRLSYLPFFVGILFLFYKKWKNHQLTVKQTLLFSIIMVLFQLIWVGAVAFSEGGWLGFFKLALAFTRGHFQDWGGSVSSVDLSLMSRAKIFLTENLLSTGFFAHYQLLAVLYGLIFFLFLLKLNWKKFTQYGSLQLPALLVLIYFIWSFLAQNIDKPRHILPLIGFINLLILVVVFKTKVNAKISILAVLLLGVQIYVATTLIKEQATSIPAIHQSAKYLKNVNQPLIVYTWEETRVYEYLNVPFAHKRLQTYEVFLHDVSYYSNQRVFLTDKVVDGFRQQGINLAGKIKKLAEFKSNELFDPVYNEVTLYEWIGQREDKTNE